MMRMGGGTLAFLVGDLGSIGRKARSLGAAAAVLIATAAGARAAGTLVEFQTSLGNVRVRLYDTKTPVTVENFRKYVNLNAWDNTFVHRVPTDFVAQGGGFKWDVPSNSAQPIVQLPQIVNEPGISNVRGTIAMAKLGTGPNTATNQWFFSLGDNSGNLDNQNGGFTVFGGVVDNGMSVLDAIDALTKFDLDQPANPSTNDSNDLLEEVPLRATPAAGLVGDRLVYVTDVRIVGPIADGDFNFDGVVNGLDLAEWVASLSSNLPQAGLRANADDNSDGVVDGADLLLLQRRLPGVPAASTSAGSVPEPAALALAAVAAGAWLTRCVKKS